MHAGFLIRHNLAKDLAGQDGAHQVEVKDPAQGLLGEVKEGLGGVGGCLGLVAAGAVDEDVHVTELLQDRSGGCFDTDLIQHVAGCADGLCAGGADLGGEGFSRGGVQIQHRNGCAGFGQGAAHGGAQHACPAGDDGGFAGKVKNGFE